MEVPLSSGARSSGSCRECKFEKLLATTCNADFRVATIQFINIKVQGDVETLEAVDAGYFVVCVYVQC